MTTEKRFGNSITRSMLIFTVLLFCVIPSQSKPAGNENGIHIVKQSAKHSSTIPRSVKAEDMGGAHKPILQPYEDELKQLAKSGSPEKPNSHTKSKRGDRQLTQILARALDRLYNRNKKGGGTQTDIKGDNKINIQTTPQPTTTTTTRVIPEVSKAASVVDDKLSDSVFVVNDDDMKYLGKLVDKVLLKLSQDEEEEEGEATTTVKSSAITKDDKEEHLSEELLPLLKTPTDGLTDLGSSKAEYDGDLTSADKDAWNKELLTILLQNAGQNVGATEETKSTQPETKPQVLSEIESRLLDEMVRADTLGVSVDELIQDLEDKAFEDALYRRIARVLKQRQ